jgi:hypothetical protein
MDKVVHFWFNNVNCGKKDATDSDLSKINCLVCLKNELKIRKLLFKDTSEVEKRIRIVQ